MIQIFIDGELCERDNPTDAGDGGAGHAGEGVSGVSARRAEALDGYDGKTSARRVLVVDDHPIVRTGLTQLLEHEHDLCVCGEAGSTPSALEGVERLRPDMLLVDIFLEGSNGIDLIKSLNQRHPGLPVLVLSMHDEELYAERALRAGARGYVMKQESPETVLQAIRRVLSGEVYVSERMASLLLRDFLRGGPCPERRGVRRLSDRELEVLERIGHAMSTRDIAEKLNLSPKTIETHRLHIREKLRLRNGAELARYAIKWVEDGMPPV